MTDKIIYSNVLVDSNPIDILGVEVTEGHKQAAARCSIELSDISGVNLNSEVSIDLGYVGDHGEVFEGLVDTITETRMPGIYSIECRDILKRAMEHYIVTTDLENPWSRSDISAEFLVRDLLEEAGITDYNGEATSFTFGTSCPAEFNLMSSWDAISQICNILAYNCYAQNGTVYFKRVTPVPAAVASATLDVGNLGNIISVNYSYDTSNLRNKVVVFGRPPIYAENSTPSPYLPVGFYKTAIVSSELIDTQSMADDSAGYNLDLYNKLTESMTLDLEGDHLIRARDTVAVTESFTGMLSTKWFVFSATHSLSEAGYITKVHLAR